MGSIKRDHTLEEKVSIGCATKEEREEWNVISKLTRVKSGKEAIGERIKETLLEFRHMEPIERLATIQRVLINAGNDILYAFQQLPSGTPVFSSGVKENDLENETV